MIWSLMILIARLSTPEDSVNRAARVSGERAAWGPLSLVEKDLGHLD